MILDVHTHLMEAPGYGPADALVADMDHLGIDRAVIFPIKLRSTHHWSMSQINDELVVAAQRHADRLIPFAGVDPNDGEETVRQEMRRAVETLECRGFKLHPIFAAFPVYEALAEPVMDEAARLGVPVLIHSGTAPYDLPLQIAKVARLFPSLTIIMGHMGLGDYWWDAIRAAQVCPNIYLETTGARLIPMIEQAIMQVGPDRVLYGSDAPFMSQEMELYKIRVLNVDESIRRMVLGENAARLLGNETT